MDGIEALTVVKKVAPRAAIIAMSGVEFSGFDPLDAAMKLGAEAPLKKPITSEDLRSVVTRVSRSGPAI